MRYGEPDHTCPIINRIQADIRAAADELENVREANSDIRAWGESNAARADDLEEKVSDLEDEMQGLRDELTSAKDEIRSLRDELAAEAKIEKLADSLTPS